MKQLNQIKLRNYFIKYGVKMIGPETVFFSKDTKIGKNVIINPYVVIGPKVNIGNNVIINSFSHLEDCKIKDNVFIGSNSSLVAPVTIGENSIIGAGSVITKNVKKKSLALTRTSQVEIQNYKIKKK